jgi:putative transposase
MLMGLIDEEYTRHPFYGSRRMRVYLQRLGHEVNRKRVQLLYRHMGLEAIYPKKNLSQPDKQPIIFPYLLRDLKIDRADHVWSTDITYIRLCGGFVYLMAVIDWYSRYVLDWSISTTLESDFCINTVGGLLLERRCEIFNTDQGAQFTTPKFIEPLRACGVQVSMDAKPLCKSIHY